MIKPKLRAGNRNSIAHLTGIHTKPERSATTAA